MGTPDRAKDLTQGLFTHLLDGEALTNLDPGRGRFRSFLYARSWALDLHGAALNDLQDEYEIADNLHLVEQLRPTLTTADDAPAYAEVATACGMSVTAVKKAAQRLRERTETPFATGSRTRLPTVRQ